jgi:hypothetical protein
LIEREFYVGEFFQRALQFGAGFSVFGIRFVGMIWASLFDGSNATS